MNTLLWRLSDYIVYHIKARAKLNFEYESGLILNRKIFVLLIVRIFFILILTIFYIKTSLCIPIDTLSSINCDKIINKPGKSPLNEENY